MKAKWNGKAGVLCLVLFGLVGEAVASSPVPFLYVSTGNNTLLSCQVNADGTVMSPCQEITDPSFTRTAGLATLGNHLYVANRGVMPPESVANAYYSIAPFGPLLGMTEGDANVATISDCVINHGPKVSQTMKCNYIDVLDFPTDSMDITVTNNALYGVAYYESIQYNPLFGYPDRMSDDVYAFTFVCPIGNDGTLQSCHCPNVGSGQNGNEAYACGGWNINTPLNGYALYQWNMIGPNAGILSYANVVEPSSVSAAGVTFSQGAMLGDPNPDPAIGGPNPYVPEAGPVFAGMGAEQLDLSQFIPSEYPLGSSTLAVLATASNTAHYEADEWDNAGNKDVQVTAFPATGSALTTENVGNLDMLGFLKAIDYNSNNAGFLYARDASTQGLLVCALNTNGTVNPCVSAQSGMLSENNDIPQNVTMMSF